MTSSRWVLAAVAAVISGGCGVSDAVDGTYCSLDGKTFVLKAGVQTVEGWDGPYTLEAERVILANPADGNVTLMRQPDGSLSNSKVTLRKCSV